MEILESYFDLIRNRRSVRAYKPESVGRDKVNKIIEAAWLAPSAGNLQAFEVYLVLENSRKKRLAEAALNQEFIAEAPVVFVFCANPERSAWKYGRRGEELYSLQDATIACTFSMLAATQLGLGCVWVGAFDENKVRKILEISREIRPVAILPVGYPAETPPFRQRRPIMDIVHEFE